MSENQEADLLHAQVLRHRLQQVDENFMTTPAVYVQPIKPLQGLNHPARQVKDRQRIGDEHLG